MPWLGFISKEDTHYLTGKPVKLACARVGRMVGASIQWVDVERGQHMQGCLVNAGVFAVYGAEARIRPISSLGLIQSLNLPPSPKVFTGFPT
jgi:hypothetical protein